MLDLLKVAGQMQGMSAQLAREAKAIALKLDLAQSLFEDATSNLELRQQQLQAWRDRLAFNCAEPMESLDTRHSITPFSAPHTIVATDGSQIAPSRHEIAYCYLINVGRVALHYGSSIYPVLDNLPEVYYKPEDLYGARQWGIQTEEWMTLKRTVAEAIALAELACGQKERSPIFGPVLALSDGSLIHWSLEMLPPEARAKILPDILAAWERLRRDRIPLAGYISAPRSTEATNFLRLQACPFPQPDCHTHCKSDAERNLDRAPCSVLQPLRDATLWQRFLQPGEASPLWRSSARILQEYGDHTVYFCYLHVGTEIARVEMPEWTALDAELRLQVLSLVLAQIQKGYGYPVALSEAHNQAVVTGSDRHRFFAILERSLIDSGLKNITTSFKETRKRNSIA
ncbi:DNA double-strand break repair nuclease NurA [Pseudanabaena sp. PCC 6802]|uniref:DNA double-strand break repair nuclease NurA n=1 Tax=Pseudanabaena sp. PCC 6802 TaxID=118173 RepID=UPI0003489461|nr:DNA double-strand break repair nuclease NurA [Pseudanabaena sp. PCC 6802]